MRRLLLLAALLLGATHAARAQARARIEARLQTPPGHAIPNLVVSVIDLLREPRWADALHNAYPITLHWRAQLWRSRTLIDDNLPPFEWDATIQEVPVVDVFRYTERIAGRSHDTSFATLDALRAYVDSPVGIPTPPGLTPGRWYYTVDLHIAALTQQQLDRTGRIDGAPDDGGASWLQRLILGSGPSTDVPRQRTATFVVRR